MAQPNFHSLWATERVLILIPVGASMIRHLAAAIICDGKVPSNWEQSLIVCLYKGKADALERGNYCSQADRAAYESPGEDGG